MRGFGLLLMVGGLLGLLHGLTMDTTVPSGEFFSSKRVYNLGLMESKRTTITVASAVLILGGILFGFGDVVRPKGQLRERKACPWCAELILAEARVCKHCGRDIGAHWLPETGQERHLRALTGQLGEEEKAEASRLFKEALEKQAMLAPSRGNLILTGSVLGALVLFYLIAWLFTG